MLNPHVPKKWSLEKNLRFVDVHSFSLNKTVQVFETSYHIPTPMATINFNINLAINVSLRSTLATSYTPGDNIGCYWHGEARRVIFLVYLLPPGWDAIPSQAQIRQWSSPGCTEPKYGYVKNPFSTPNLSQFILFIKIITVLELV